MKPSIQEYRVISLEGKSERLRKFVTHFPFTPDNRVISAVDGRKVAKSYPKDRQKVIGYFASHVNAFREVVFEKRPFISVFEEGALPAERAFERIEEFLDQAQYLKWDLLHLGSRLGVEDNVKVHGTGWMHIEGGFTDTYAYIASRRFVDAFLAHFAPGNKKPSYGAPLQVGRAFKELMVSRPDLTVYSLKDPLFTQDNDLPSDVIREPFYTDNKL